MKDVMLQLGNFQFYAPDAAYQQLNRVSTYVWAAVARLGNHPARQFVGKDDKATLTGYILPALGGSRNNISALRIMADQGKPWQLTAGTGRIHGYWVIESVGETGTIHGAEGMARRIDFTLSLAYYGEDDA